MESINAHAGVSNEPFVAPIRKIKPAEAVGEKESGVLARINDLHLSESKRAMLGIVSKQDVNPESFYTSEEEKTQENVTVDGVPLSEIKTVVQTVSNTVTPIISTTPAALNASATPILTSSSSAVENNVITEDSIQEVAPVVSDTVIVEEVFVPTSPEEDPNFLALQARVETTSDQQQKTRPATQEANAAQAAAAVPTNENMGIAQTSQVDSMEESSKDTKEFDAEAFKAALMKRIDEMKLPEDEEGAENFDKNNNIQEVSDAASQDASTQQENIAGPIDTASSAEPDTAGLTQRKAAVLAKAPVGLKPMTVNANAAMPKARPDSQITTPLQENASEMDSKMDEAGVTDEQLAISNEPTFTSALDSKNDAKTQTNEASGEFRQGESATLIGSEQVAAKTGEGGLEEMHQQRGKALNSVVGKQKKTGTKETTERERIANEINTIYNKTKVNVEGILAGLSTEVTAKFDKAATKAKEKFEEHIDDEMFSYKLKRYTEAGLTVGLFRWVKDVFVGLPDEVNEFFVEGRKIYVDEMDIAITDIAQFIGVKLNEAKTAIEVGKQEVNDYVKELPGNLRKYGKEAASNIQEKFDELTDSVDSKQGELIESLAQQYSDSLASVDARIEEMKAANRGLIDMVMGFINGVIETILKLKQLIADLLTEIEKALPIIMADPIGFVLTLFEGVKQGFNNFTANIKKHLIGGFFNWLSGAMGPMGITMPENVFSLKGIFSLVTQMLGLSWEFIKRKATILFGAPAMKVLEKGMEIFQILRKDGLAGLWEHIKDQFQDLKETVIENIKSMLVTQVIEAGVKWLLSLLIPGAGFVKAIIAIKDFIVFFVESAIMLIPAMIEAIQALAAGNVSGIAVAIETGLGILIPLLISLFARLIGLGSVVKKVQKIIEKIRKKISEKVTKFLKSIKERVKTFLNKLGFGKKKGKKDKESGKSKGDGEVGHTIKFKAGGENHRLWVDDKNKGKLMIASSPVTVETKLKEWNEVDISGWDPKIQQEIKKLIKEAGDSESVSEILLKDILKIKKKNKKADKPDHELENKKDSKLEKEQDVLAPKMKKLFNYFEEGGGNAGLVVGLHPIENPTDNKRESHHVAENQFMEQIKEFYSIFGKTLNEFDGFKDIGGKLSERSQTIGTKYKGGNNLSAILLAKGTHTGAEKGLHSSKLQSEILENIETYARGEENVGDEKQVILVGITKSTEQKRAKMHEADWNHFIRKAYEMTVNKKGFNIDENKNKLVITTMDSDKKDLEHISDILNKELKSKKGLKGIELKVKRKEVLDQINNTSHNAYNSAFVNAFQSVKTALSKSKNDGTKDDHKKALDKLKEYANKLWRNNIIFKIKL